MRLKSVAALLVALSVGCGSPVAEAPGFRAFGNEPFWNVTLSAADGIVYGRMGEGDISFPYVAPRYTTDESTTHVFGPVQDGTAQHHIEVRISDENCPDTMADIVHPMRAKVTVDGEELLGCARTLYGIPPGERP